MKKSAPIVSMVNYGRYSQWDKNSRKLPVIQEITDAVPCESGVEFGYILNIKRAKGKSVQFCIDHPPFKDTNGQVEPPFEGEVFVTSNNYDLFLGDSVWEPIHDKSGFWKISAWVDDVLVAEKSIRVIEPEVDDFGIDW